MINYKIEYSEDAKQDLIDIKRYIKYTLKEPNIANKLIAKIKKAIESLKTTPEMYRIIEDNFIRKLEIRKMIVENYIVFYRINDTSVQIVRVLYGRRDWKKLL